MASSPQKNLQFISPPKEAGDFLQNQVKFFYIKHQTFHIKPNYFTMTDTPSGMTVIFGDRKSVV